MSVESFLDTNLFIYQLDASDEHKSTVADGIIREGVETGNACISYQVVQECLNIVLRKAEVPLDVTGARAYLDHVLTPLLRVSASAHLYHRGLEFQDRYRYGFYDSLIIACPSRKLAQHAGTGSPRQARCLVDRMTCLYRATLERTQRHRAWFTATIKARLSQGDPPLWTARWA